MIRSCRSIEVIHVAGVTGSRRGCVVVVGVALRAGYRGMESGERIVGIERVIEGRVEPVACAVATVARVREIHLHVAGVAGSVEIIDVAGVAILRNGCVVVVCVALRAGKRGVGADERKRC